MFPTLEIQYDGPVATVWMNRPELHNAFNLQLITDITAAYRELGANDTVRIVILAGRGKSFSAGADLHWMKAAGQASAEDNRNEARQLAVMLRTLAELRKPTIARVHGAALGGGLGLAAACDLCVAAANAVFATSEVRFGIIPATIGPYVIRAIGERQAYRYFQTAERMDAQRALEIGLVHEVAAPEDLDIRVQQLTDALLLGGPQAQAAAKDLIRAVAGQSISDVLAEDTACRIAAVRATPEAREGLAAFLEKRPPAWTSAGARVSRKRGEE
ncbi:MAG TPA: enoyl-CoA hydratase/isomerase family protein [Candidatus Competibacteraceae bacterium]|nr:enoyl-CoA hydratase/isomerase family protein [Candidatus Competibacteraceae bacterium]MCP5133192.1 enoyl-CoA hydratase/isomerase family protein [Gammaproteobacteria bacterium]HPF57940.1 enoyl-CoA hydratase/isomerase family protein [Candidatus Competibacteraceae bacterium]HRY17692.1 enoyl-CoA hydratase/isomerase family protein [Candidatus Competibacteraceae bacterium]